jgi:hypothetical protein
MTDARTTTVEIVDSEGNVFESYTYGEATPDAKALQTALLNVIEVEGKRVAATGKVPDLKDVISALTGILGSFIAGIEDQRARDNVFSQTGVLLHIAIQMALQAGMAQHVATIDRSKVQ